MDYFHILSKGAAKTAPFDMCIELLYILCLLTAAALIAAVTYRRIVLTVLKKFTSLGREEFVNREINAVEQVARVVVGCTYPK